MGRGAGIENGASGGDLRGTKIRILSNPNVPQRFSMMSESYADGAAYIHGADAEEQARLALMNGLINENCLRELALAPGASVLDVGSGTGEFTRAMGAAVGPAGRVVAVEREARQLAVAQRHEAPNVDWRQGSAYQLPLRAKEWGHFEVAHTRFLLEHLPDPGAAVRQMVQAVRPGGRVVLADDDHSLLRCAPEPPGFHALWQAYCTSYHRLGNDPYIGRRLPALLHAAGAQPQRVTWVFYGACAGDPALPAYVQNLIEVLQGARATLLKHDLFDPNYFDDVIAEFAAWQTRPDAALWYGINWAEGRKPR